MKYRKVLNNKDLISLSKSLNLAYGLVDENLIHKFSKKFSINNKSAKIIIRRNMVPLTYFFFYNFLILSKNFKFKLINREKINFQFSFQKIENFEDFISKKKFNKNFLSLLKKNFFISNKKNDINDFLADEIKTEDSQDIKNNLFIIGQKYLLKFFILLENYFFRFLPSFQKIPVLHLSQLQNSFFVKGWYISLFKNLNYPFFLKNSDVNKKIRNSFFSGILPLNFYKKFFLKYKIKNLDYEHFSNIFDNYISSFFPVSCFEDFEKNLIASSKKLEHFKQKIILSSGDFDTHSVFYNCAAKNDNFKIIKIQHGGYEGYVDQIPKYYEIEYASADYFFSWGWTDLVDKKNKLNIKILPMPSPWLSERKKYFNKINNDNSKKVFDLLWMPNKIRNYDISPSGINNINTIDTNFSLINFKKFANHLKKKNIITYCKFYNEYDFKVYTKYLKKDLSHYPNIKFIKNFDKGLDNNILLKVKLVIWDIPGTGFLECLSSNIPTLCYVDKNIINTHKSQKSLFHELNKVGIINYNYNDLLKNICLFIKDEKKWSFNKKRHNVVRKFTYKFARTDDNWDKIWKNKIIQIAKKNER